MEHCHGSTWEEQKKGDYFILKCLIPSRSMSQQRFLWSTIFATITPFDSNIFIHCFLVKFFFYLYFLPFQKQENFGYIIWVSRRLSKRIWGQKSHSGQDNQAGRQLNFCSPSSLVLTSLLVQDGYCLLSRVSYWCLPVTSQSVWCNGGQRNRFKVGKTQVSIIDQLVSSCGNSFKLCEPCVY